LPLLEKSWDEGCSQVQHPLLSAKHRKARLDFAYAHRDWTLEDWKLVVWSDETQNPIAYGQMVANGLGKSQERGLVTDWWQGTVKFGGGSVMVWACMTWEGVGMLLRLMVGWMGTFTFQIFEE